MVDTNVSTETKDISAAQAYVNTAADESIELYGDDKFTQRTQVITEFINKLLKNPDTEAVVRRPLTYSTLANAALDGREALLTAMKQILA